MLSVFLNLQVRNFTGRRANNNSWRRRRLHYTLSSTHYEFRSAGVTRGSPAPEPAAAPFPPAFLPSFPAAAARTVATDFKIFLKILIFSCPLLGGSLALRLFPRLVAADSISKLG
nr:hypothetical protein Itr_chr07CG04800 [Ipomoea trifida]